VQGLPVNPRAHPDYLDVAYWAERQIFEGTAPSPSKKTLDNDALLALPRNTQWVRGVGPTETSHFEVRYPSCSSPQELKARLLAAVLTLLYRYTRAETIAIDVIVSDRERLAPLCEDVIGNFDRFEIIEASLDGQLSFTQLTEQVAQSLGGPRYPRRPSAHAACIFADCCDHVIKLCDGIEIKSKIVEHQILPSHELLFEFSGCESTVGHVVQIKYPSRVYDEAMIVDMGASLRSILHSITNSPGTALAQIELRPQEELLSPTLGLLSGSSTPFPQDALVQDLFLEHARAHPTKAAIISHVDSTNDGGPCELTYQRLVELSESLSTVIRRELGNRCNQTVGLAAPRSASLLVGQLGVLRSGNTFICLDPAAPRERNEYILHNAGVVLLLHAPQIDITFTEGRKLPLSLTDGIFHQEMNPLSSSLCQLNSADTVAMLVYTSGTTGHPKGIKVSHKNIVNMFSNTKLFQLTANDTVLPTTAVQFDMSILEGLGTLCNGGSLVLCSSEDACDPFRVEELVNKHRVTKMVYVSALFNQHVLLRPSLFRNLHEVILGGDVVLTKPVLEVMDQYPSLNIIPGYGPTECTMVSTYYQVDKEQLRQLGEVPIGKPIDNMHILILEESSDHVAPIGIPGEMVIAGDGVAMGYLDLPETNRQKFIPNRWQESWGPVVYRTGDRARRLSDGNILFLGRLDNQVKVRGNRVELREITSALITHPAIADAYTSAHGKDKLGERVIISYIVPSRGLRSTAGEEHDALPSVLRAFLQERLPKYMIPTHFILLPHLPKTVNQKVDVSKLPTAPEAHDALRTGETTSEGRLADRLIAAWKEELGVAELSLDNSCEELGATSLHIPRLAARAREILGPSVSLADVSKSIRYLLSCQAGRSAVAREQERKPALLPCAPSRDIAVIGMATQAPKAKGKEEFWGNLLHGKECISIFSEEQLLAAGVAPELVNDPNYVPARGILSLENLDSFDGALFHISAEEAKLLNPIQKLFLMTAYDAMLDAGYADAQFGTHKVGVFYSAARLEEPVEDTPCEAEHLKNFLKSLVREPSLIGQRLCYAFDFRGPCLHIQTACSSSLVAVHQACRALRDGQCEIALAGGVDLHENVGSKGYLFSPKGILSADGHCRPLDKDATGGVPSSGAGIVVLKALEAALRDGDAIYAVIKGSAVSNDGSEKLQFIAPGELGQVQAISEALLDAGATVADIAFVELNGSGNPYGDAMELCALRKVFADRAATPAPCYLGSLKGNYGHLGVASGIAGLLKTALALSLGSIPPTINHTEPREELTECPFKVNTEPTPWPETPKKMAGVSSFGAGGTNVHVVLTQAPEGAVVQRKQQQPPLSMSAALAQSEYIYE